LANHNPLGKVAFLQFDQVESRVGPNLSIFHARIGSLAMRSRDRGGVTDEFLKAPVNQRGGSLLSASSPAVVGCTTVMSLAVTLGAELCSANPARVARYWRWSHRDFGFEYRRCRPVSRRRNSPERIRLANRMVYVLCDAHAAGSNAPGFNLDQHFKRSELES
jgi:hypothetical protein